MNVSRWLRGHVYASPHRSYVRVQLEGQFGAQRMEVYIDHKEARELRDSLDHILAKTA